jgi:DNA-binding CsgD family transcriptional regulator
MMVKITPETEKEHCPYPVPRYLVPMMEAASRGDSLLHVVESIVSGLGFESFVYGMSLAETHSRDERFYVWATVAKEWLREYDQNSYIEIDPRVSYGWEVLPPPLIWDASIANGNLRVTRFLDRAAEFGIGSGVAVYLRDDISKIMVALSSRERYLTSRRRAAICAVTGQIMHLTSLFHWAFVKGVVARGIPPAQEGHPLSRREISCLQFAAHGMTSKDIGVKLGITQRTANFHFANVISKLGVLNRHEAIATAVAHGLIKVNNNLCGMRKRRSR